MRKTYRVILGLGLLILSCQAKEERFKEAIEQRIREYAASENKTVDFLEVSGVTFKEADYGNLEFLILNRIQRRIKHYEQNGIVGATDSLKKLRAQEAEFKSYVNKPSKEKKRFYEVKYFEQSIIGRESKEDSNSEWIDEKFKPFSYYEYLNLARHK